MKNNFPPSLLLITGLLLLAGASGVQAANVTKLDTATMNGGAVDWSSAPAASDVGEFAATPSAGTLASMALGGNLTLAGLQLDNNLAGPLTVATGSTLTLGSSGINLSAANNDATFNCGITLGSGTASSGQATWNVAAGRTLTLAAVPVRVNSANNGTVGGSLTVGATGTVKFGAAASALIIDASGDPYVTYGLNDWAALDSSGTVIVANYTIAGTALTAGVINTITNSFTGANATIDVSALRFNDATARTLTVNGNNTLTARGILVTANSGGGAITGGNVRAARVAIAGCSFAIVQNSASDFIINSVIPNASSSAPTAIVKSGTGRLILNGTNTTTGQIFINQGTLQLGTNGTSGILGSTTAIVYDNGTFAVNHSTATTIANVITGSGGVQQLGTGATTLSAVNTYTGNTVISNNTLLQLAATGSINNSSNIIVGAGATYDASLVSGYTLGGSQILTGSGTVTGVVTTVSGSGVSGGTDGTYGTNTFANDLTLVAGALAYFDVSTNLGTNDEIVVNGNLTLNSTVFHLKAPNTSATLPIGDYVLVTNAGTFTVNGSLSLVWDVAPLNAASSTIVTVGNTVVLRVAPPVGPFISAASINTNSAYPNQVVFISATVSTNGSTLNSLVAGSGALVGSPISLVLSNGNVYTNSTTVASAATLGSNPLTITAVDNVNLTNILAVPFTVVSGVPTIVASASLNPSTRTQTVFVSATVTSNSYPLNVGSITVNLSSLGGLATTSLVLSNANVYTNSVTISTNILAGPKSLTVTAADTGPETNTAVISFTVAGLGEVWNGSGSDNKWISGLNWTSGLSPLTGDLVTFAGTVQTTPNLETGYSIGSLTFDATAGSFNITNGANTLTLTGNVTNNSTSGQALSVPVALSGVPVINTALGNITVSNTISGSGGGLTKVGANTLTLAANNTYTGPTTVSAGTLVLAGDNSGGLSAVTNGATLRLANTNAVKGALVLADSSTLQLRADADTAFTPASLALNNPTTTLNFDVDTLTGTVGKKLTLTGGLSYPSLVNAVINVTGGSGDTLVLGAIAGSTVNTSPHRPFTINVVPNISLIMASFTSINFGNDLTMQGGGNVTVTGNLANTSNGSVDLNVNGGTTVTLQGVSAKTGTGDGYRYYVNSGTLALDNSGALTNNTTGTGLNQSFFFLGVTNNASANSSNCTVYLGDSNFPNGGLSVNAKTTNYVADGGAAFLNTGIFTIGGQNTSGTNTYANPIILGWTASLGKSVTLVAATGGEVDFTGGILVNPGNATAGVTVGDATHGGTVKLIGANTYAGGTMVSNGTLLVSGSLASSVVVANGATMGGAATITGSITVQSGGALVPGKGTNAAGILVSLVNNLTLNSGSFTTMAVSHNAQTNDQVSLGSGMTYAGTLTVVTNAGDGAFTVGDTFRLFKFPPNFVGGIFTASNLPPLSAGLAWSNSLAVDGSIEVISSGVAPPPVAGVTNLTSATGSAPLSVTFSNLTTGATNYLWSFGDGGTLTTSANTNVTYSYNTPGTYTNILTAYGVGGTNAATNAAYIVVTPPAPVAGIGALSATNIFVGQSVVFTNLSSGSITNWIWNFGNGTSVTNASGINVTNAYGSVGSYLVNLTVAGAGGSGTSGNLTVTVKGKVSLGKPVLSGGSLILGGTNGPAGQQYRILSSTNVALNVTNWVAVWTNVFATDGSYSYTNSPLTNKATFFKLVSP